MATALLILATYYVAVTVTKLHGPFGICEAFRHRVWRWRGFEDQGHYGLWMRGTDEVSDDWVAAGVQCPLCASLYVSVILCALAGAWTGIEVLAVAGGASVLFSLGRYR